MNKVRWGIIGPGIIAHQFAKDIRFTSNAVLEAVASNSEDRARDFADTYNIPKAYTGYKALLEDPDVDAVYVATTHNFHLENSFAALEAGKPVLCEKPLTDNLPDALKLFEAVKEIDVYLMEGMWTYFLPTIKKVQEWIAQRRIGQVVNVKANFGYPRKFDSEHRLFNPKLSGGVLLDMGIYPVAMAWLFMQEDPLSYNVLSKNAMTGVDSDVNMQLIYENNRVANLHTSFEVKLHNYCYIYGDKGYIEIPDFWRSREAFLYDGENIIERYNDNRQGLGFEFQIEAASEDILNGLTESAIMPHAYSLKLQKHMSEIMKRF